MNEDINRLFFVYSIDEYVSIISDGIYRMQNTIEDIKTYFKKLNPRNGLDEKIYKTVKNTLDEIYKIYINILDEFEKYQDATNIHVDR